MRELINLGVDGMFTDFPDRLDEVLGEEAAVNRMQASVRAADASRSCQADDGQQLPETGGRPARNVCDT